MRLIHLATVVLLTAPFAQALPGIALINTPTPMLEPAFPECEQFHQVMNKSQNCGWISWAHAVDVEELMRLNPGIKSPSDCSSLRIGYFYCTKAKGNSPVPGSKPEPQAPSPTKPANTEGGKSKKGDQEKRPKQPAKPTITSPPTVQKGQCSGSGVCAGAWQDLHWFGDEDKKSAIGKASDLCTQIYNTRCENHMTWGFPGNIIPRCMDCGALSSACACFIGGFLTTLPSREDLDPIGARKGPHHKRMKEVESSMTRE